MAEALQEPVVSKIKNFTPVFDSVVRDVGLVGATIFGVIWRHCQMSRSVCDASKETLAEKCGVSERTVIRWTKALCEAGYLEDLTPKLRNKPHIYRDTGKVRLVAEVSAVTESQTDPEEGMTESHSTMTESHPAMTESQSHHDTESHEETRKKQRRNKEETPARDFLDDVFTHTQKPKPEGRPKGWESASETEYIISKRVAELWGMGKLPTGRFGSRIEDQCKGAGELLDYHDGDLRACLLTLDKYHAQFDGGITISGPQSLVNVIPAFVAEQSRTDSRASPGRKRGSHRREYEPCTDTERQAMWDLHGEWMKALMARKREEIDPRIDALRFRSVIGQQLGLDERQAQALCEAFGVWEAETAEPLDIEALLREEA